MNEKRYNDILKALELWEVDIEEGTVKTRRGQATTRTPKGYLCVGTNIDGKTVEFKVHQLIAVKKWGSACIGMTIDHIDGNKLNNSWHNLELVSVEENAMRAYASGLYQKQQKEIQKEISRTKLTNIDVAYIRAKFEAREGTITGLSKLFNVSQACISNIVNGKTYLNIEPLRPAEVVLETRLF